MNKRTWLILAAIAVVLGIGLYVFWPFSNGNTLRLPGVVEIQEVRLGSKVGGRVRRVLINEGVIVTPGTLLVEFEGPELENQKRQLQAKLASAKSDLIRIRNGSRHEIETASATADAAKARYDRIEFGWREEEKKQALSELQTTQADLDQALKDWVRISGLYQKDSATRSEYDAAFAFRERTRGRRDAAQAKVDMMKEGSRKEDKAEAYAEWQRAKGQLETLKVTRPEDIIAAQAKVAEIEEHINAVEINIKETRLIVPHELGKAVVEVVAVRPGDLVQPNQAVVRVLRVEDLWVKIFVPETQYGLVTLGMKVDVRIDSHPGVVFEGVVIQRSNISEFTPRNVQSVDERRHQVFGVKVHVPNAKGILNAGMAAEVTIPIPTTPP